MTKLKIKDMKLLITALFLTFILGGFWFFFFQGKEDDTRQWLSEKKEEVFPAKTESDNGGFETLEFNFSDEESLEDLPWHLTLVKVSPQDFDFRLVLNQKDALMSIEDIAQENNCEVAMNGVFFDSKFDPLGLIVEDGKVINSAHTGELASGVFYVTNDYKADIVPYSDYVVEDDVLALQSGPLILKADGSTEISENSIEKDARSFLGVDEEGFVYLGIVYPKTERGWQGVSLYELAKMFQDSEDNIGIKMKAVLNLDGGSSTGLYTKYSHYSEKNLPENVICLGER